MSYVEKAIYSYLRSTMTNGIRVLVSRRFLLFSISLLLIAGASSVATYLNGLDTSVITEKQLELIFSLQASAVFGLILSGFVSRKVKNTIARFTLLIIFLVLYFALIFVSDTIDQAEIVKQLLTDTIPLLTFLSWCIVVPISTFVFSSSLFSNKILGSILFLGKPIENKNSLFVGPILIVAVICMILGGVLYSQGGVLFGSFVFVLSLFMLPIMWGWLTSDDVFTTGICFFFVFSTPSIILLAFTGGTGSEVISSLNLILVLFSLLFAAQGVAKKVKKVLDNEKEQEKEDDPFRISKFIRLISGEGLVLVLLGILLGWHLVTLKVISPLEPQLYTAILGTDSVSDFYKKLTVITTAIVLLGSVIFFNSWGRYRRYFGSDIYRFNILPPYEELEDFFRRMKKGEVSWAGFTANLAKKAVMGGVQKIKGSSEKSGSPIRSVLDLIRGGSGKKKKR